VVLCVGIGIVGRGEGDVGADAAVDAITERGPGRDVGGNVCKEVARRRAGAEVVGGGEARVSRGEDKP
jgi:hypothetical protein